MSRFAYADPPYPGQSAKHYRNHPDYAGEVDHRELLLRLETYDGWCLHTSSPALPGIMGLATDLGIKEYRIAAWVKPFAAFKPNVPVAYAWEPVIIKAVRLPKVNKRVVMRDWIDASITMKKGLAGVKPCAVVEWVLEVCGVDPGDSLDDLFPGSGAVTKAWNAWKHKVKLSNGGQMQLLQEGGEG